LVGALGRGAFDAASRFGRKVLGDHVPKVDEQLKKLVQSAVSQSLSLAIEQLATRAAHPKSQAEIRSRVATSTRRLFRLPTEAALEPLLALPLEAIAAVVSAVLRHNLARPEIRRVVVDELRLFVDALGDRPVGDWLGDRRAAFARDLRELLGPLFAGFFASADYASWLAEASKRTPTIATDGNPSDSS
ncbi:MAG: hypothetical protein KC609_11525, partial [Myxococcales bacterium]|nr:hypothetical protein [Myxococcales bacterium]